MSAVLPYSSQLAVKPPVNASPPVPLVATVRLLARGFASSILVLCDIPPLLTAYAIGQLFAVYGKLRVNVVFSQRTSLTAVLQFADGRCAHFAHSSLNGSILELDTDVERGEDKAAKKEGVVVQRYVFDIRFAEEPLQISTFTTELKLRSSIKE